MSEGLEQLMDRWTSDAGLRTRLQSDPEAAIRETGIELDNEDWEALRSARFDLSDSALSERVNKGWTKP